MTVALIIPTPRPAMENRVELVIESIAFVLRLRWMTRLRRWHYGFWVDEETPILVGRRLIPGVSMNNRYTGDLLPDGVFACARMDGTDAPVGRDELGDAAFIYYMPREEFEASRPPQPSPFRIVRITEVV